MADEMNIMFTKEVQMSSKYMKRMFSIFGHKGNAHQNDILIPSQIGHYQEDKEQEILVRI
jgi:hypothetical protein